MVLARQCSDDRIHVIYTMFKAYKATEGDVAPVLRACGISDNRHQEWRTSLKEHGLLTHNEGWTGRCRLTDLAVRLILPIVAAEMDDMSKRLDSLALAG